MPVRAPRLPGVRFEVVEPPRDDLPRMDIAVFVGFAASGPLDLPVVVEDMADYAEIFGGDLPLAFDPSQGTRIGAYLPQAVRAFFRNGGRRCWVIRVADRATAEANRFRLPGLWRPLDRGDFAGAWAEARSPGSWSDQLRVAAVLRSEPLTCHHVRPDGPGRLELGITGTRDLAPGDLLRATLLEPAAPRQDQGLGYLLAVDRIGPAPAGSTSIDAGVGSPLAEAPVDGCVAGPTWLFELGPVGSPLDAPPGSPPTAEREGGAPLTPSELWRAPAWVADAPEQLPLALPHRLERLTFDLIARAQGQPTQRLRGLGFAPSHQRFWAALPSDARLLRPADQPPATGDDVLERGTAPGPLWDAARTPRFPVCGHGAPRVVYLPLGMSPADVAELGATHPTVASASDDPSPIGLAATSVSYAGASHGPGTPLLHRDGLGHFAVDLFLDRRLATVGSDRLMAEAAFIRYEAPTTRRLVGIHAALLELEETSLVAIPDAVHRGWQAVPQPPTVESVELPLATVPPASCTSTSRRWHHAADTPGPAGLPTPRLTSPVAVHLRSEDDAVLGSFRLAWSTVPDADVGYVVEEARHDDFRDRRQVFAGARTSASITGREPGRYVYRVRALGTARVSPWSRPVEVQVAPTGSSPLDESGAFTDCGVLPAPRLSIPVIVLPSAAIARASYRLEWSPVRGADHGYVLEEAGDDEFRDSRLAYRGPDRAVTIDGQPAGTFVYRVRALGAAAESPWSRPIQVRVDPAEPAELLPQDDVDATELVRLHQATLSLCAARGDMFAVLAVHAHDREDAALTHADRLGASSAPRTLSFGALYHPWLVGRGGEVTGELRALPPDGAMCGQIARRTLVAGAWSAPANHPLPDVLALTPALSPARRLELQEGGVNEVRHEPRGFLVLAANTLTDDDELRSISIRRLLILVRRLALRRGARYVFEPNDATFQRLVQRGFEATLDDLFVRGAFAGDTPERAYRVDTGPAQNTPQSIDAGRFIIELRVAPSRPLSFLTVRLVQTGDRSLAVLER